MSGRRERDGWKAIQIGRGDRATELEITDSGWIVGKIMCEVLTTYEAWEYLGISSVTFSLAFEEYNAPVAQLDRASAF